MRQQTFVHEGLQIAWAERGEGSPLVFQHGLGADLSQSLSLLNTLHDTRLITMDCRAHGASDVGDETKLSFQTYADDLVALLDELNIPRVWLGGLSMGAGVALNFAIRFPERVTALALVRPAWLDAPMDVREWFFAVASHIRQHGAEQGKVLFADSALFREIAAQSPYVATGLLTQFDSPRAVDGVARLERLPADVPVADRALWASLQVPVLIVGHSGDPIHPLSCAEGLANGIPTAELVHITPKAVDLAAHEREIQDALANFLRIR